VGRIASKFVPLMLNGNQKKKISVRKVQEDLATKDRNFLSKITKSQHKNPGQEMKIRGYREDST
jgi:hypothetical protein